MRNTRVLARAARRAIDTGDDVPAEAIEAITHLAEAARALGPGLPEGTGEERARASRERGTTLATEALERYASGLSASVIVGQVRSTAVDVLRGMGMEPDAARAAVRGAELEEGS